ncbi:hypothetical protein D3C81_1197270 [compost metagenome]
MLRLVRHHGVVAELCVVRDVFVDGIAQGRRCLEQLAAGRQHLLDRTMVVVVGPIEESGELVDEPLDGGFAGFQQLAVGLVRDILAGVQRRHFVEALPGLGDVGFGLLLGRGVIGDRMAVQAHAQTGHGVADDIQVPHTGQRVRVEVLESFLGLVELPDAADSEEQQREYGDGKRKKQALGDIHGVWTAHALSQCSLVATEVQAGS